MDKEIQEKVVAELEASLNTALIQLNCLGLFEKAESLREFIENNLDEIIHPG